MAATMARLICCHLLFVVLCCVSFAASSDDDLYSLVVEHTFDSGSQAIFKRRGLIDVHSLKSGAADYSSEVSLSELDKTALKELALSGGMYRVRIGKWTSDETTVSYVYTFIKACALYESRLTDTITIHVDQSGGLIATALTSPVPYCSGGELNHRSLTDFNTTVEVQQTVNGPVPETQAYIQKIEHEKAERAKGQQGDNRSFFAKYWMYLVPAVVFMMLLSNMDPSAAQGGGGGR